MRDHVDDDLDDAPLAFLLTAPAGFTRTHQLVDRMGFVLSQGRGLDSGLHALASHLTAFTAPAPGTVRLRARTLIGDDRIIVCLFPLLSVPPIDERALAGAGLAVVDRLVLDVDIATGTVVGVPIPWPAIGELRPPSGHLGTGRGGAVTAVIDAAPPDSPAPTRAAVVAKLAGGATHGHPEDVLDAVVRLVEQAELRATAPEPHAFVDALTKDRAGRSVTTLGPVG